MDYDGTFSIEGDNDTSLPCLQPIFAPLSTSTPLPVSDHLETPRRATVLDDDFLMIPSIDLHPDALYTTVSDHLETPRRATVLDDDFLMTPMIDLHPDADALYTTVVKRRPLAHLQKMKNLRERKEIKMAIPCTPKDMYDQTLYSACSESQGGEQQIRYKRKIENQHLEAQVKSCVTPIPNAHYRRASNAVTPEVPAFTPPPRPDVKFFDRNKRLAPIRAERMLPSPLPKPLSRSKRLAPIKRKKQVAKKRVRFEQLI